MAGPDSSSDFQGAFKVGQTRAPRQLASANQSPAIDLYLSLSPLDRELMLVVVAAALGRRPAGLYGQAGEAVS